MVFVSKDSDAGFQFIPIAVQLFGRSLFRKRLFAKAKEVALPTITKPPGMNNLRLEKAVRDHKRKSDLVDLSSFLADQIWDKNKNNPSSTVIVNVSEKNYNTGEINVQLRDEDTGKVDIHAKIEPIDIPPRSQLLLDMNFRDLSNDGVKRLHGVYNSEQKAEKSGRILVASNTKGMSIKELYEKYNRTYDGGMKNIILQ